jgi:hypothetical protein
MSFNLIIFQLLCIYIYIYSNFYLKSATTACFINEGSSCRWQAVPAAAGFRTRDLQITIQGVSEKEPSWKKFTTVR